MIIGLDDPEAVDEERKPFWLVTDENDAMPRKGPENPYGDTPIDNTDKFNEEKGGLGLAINMKRLVKFYKIWTIFKTLRPMFNIFSFMGFRYVW